MLRRFLSFKTSLWMKHSAKPRNFRSIWHLRFDRVIIGRCRNRFLDGFFYFRFIFSSSCSLRNNTNYLPRALIRSAAIASSTKHVSNGLRLNVGRQIAASSLACMSSRQSSRNLGFDLGTYSGANSLLITAENQVLTARLRALHYALSYVRTTYHSLTNPMNSTAFFFPFCWRRKRTAKN